MDYYKWETFNYSRGFSRLKLWTCASLLLILVFQEASARTFEAEHQAAIQAFERASDQDKAQSLISLVNGAVDNYPEQALQFAAKAKELDTALTETQQMELSELRCWGNVFLQRYYDAENDCRQTLKLALANDNVEYQGAAYNGLASIASLRGEDVKSIQLYEQAIAVSPEPTRRSAGHSNIAGLYKDQGVYDLAFDHYSKALAELEETNLSEARRCYYSAPSYTSIGDMNLRLREFEAAQHYYELSLECGEVANDSWNQVAGLSGLANVAIEQIDLSLADELTSQAVRVAKGKSDVVVELAKTIRAKYLRAIGQFDEAYKLAFEADQATDSSDSLSSGNLDLMLLLIQLNMDLEQEQTALDMIQELEEKANELGRREVLERVLELKHQVYAANGLFQQAYEAQQAYISVAEENLTDRSLYRVSLLQAEVGLSEQKAATVNAEALAKTKVLEAERATFLRNATLIAGFMLLVIGYLFVTRQLQVKEIAANDVYKQKLEQDLRVQSRKLKEQSDHALELETQIVHSQKLEAVGQLTGGVAHDFNNILVIVLGAIELLKVSEESRLSAGDQKLLTQASDAIATGTEIIQQLLAYSRQQPLEATATEIIGLLQGIMSLLNRTLGDRVRFSHNLSSEPVWCEIDRAQLTTVILNLAINARDACEDVGSVSLTCEQISADASHDKLQPGEYCQIEMLDNGSGMSPEVLDKVIEPFFTTKDAGQGNGLGLSMVYGFVKQSRGDMHIQSSLDHGTTVTLWLPICAAPEKVATNIPDSSLKPGVGVQSVLVVEDQEEVLEIATRMVGDLGYQVHQASSGDEAKDMLVGGLKPDVVFSDVSMPGELDGLGLAKWISDYAPGLPVLLTSGYPQEGLAQYSAGFVAKPYRAAEIRQLFDQVS